MDSLTKHVGEQGENVSNGQSLCSPPPSRDAAGPVLPCGVPRFVAGIKRQWRLEVHTEAKRLGVDRLKVLRDFAEVMYCCSVNSTSCEQIERLLELLYELATGDSGVVNNAEYESAAALAADLLESQYRGSRRPE